ncbi:hypothetical protein HAINFHK1212_0389 [Haemophilus influenzae HK1212]|uniref:Uncharacterized protein n=1 Tax=Haemophilus influenzae HK1212 TaxID=456482 RepID=A0A7G2JZH1_HAEIF|nr:hypothetical protein HAINFHK1212_0389 [Haemophilus influenzae HK1212]
MLSEKKTYKDITYKMTCFIKNARAWRAFLSFIFS